MDALQQGAADEAVIAIDIADADAEEKAGAEVVGLADPDAVGGVVAFQLEAVDEAGIGADQIEQAGQLGDIVLAVAIGVEDEVLGGGVKAAAQGAAVAAILGMGDDAQAGAILGAQLIENGGGIVVAAIVDHDDFVIGHVELERVERLGEQLGQRGGVVVGREEDAQ